MKGGYFIKRLFFLGSILTIFLISGCSNISEDEAEKIIIDQYSNFNGTTEIISTDKKDGEYYIEWINEGDGAKGVSKVSSDGEITVIEAEIQ